MIVTTLNEAGFDGDAFLERAGLEPERLGSPDARYSVDPLQILWSHALDATKNPSFGIEVARHWHPTTMHALGYAWMASESLVAAMERAVDYGHIVSTDLSFEIATALDSLEFSVVHDDRRPELLDAEVDAVLAVLAHMCRITHGGTLRPLQVQMTRAAPPDSAPYRHFFNAPVQFAANRNAIELPKSDATRRLLTSNAALARVSDELAIEYLTRIERSRLSLQVRKELIGLLPEGNATQRSVAKRVGVSARGLQRKLAREGTSYQMVLDETRSKLALEYLNSGFDIQKIAFMLGFSDSSAFTKAFKRWFSASPIDYRRGGK